MSDPTAILSTGERTRSLSHSIDDMIAEMTSASSVVTDIPNLIGTSVTGGASGGVDQRAISGIGKMTGVNSSLSSQCPFPRRLSPELLAAIFLECARDDTLFRSSRNVPRWIVVSYVCQYWRNVALHCANLWGNHLSFVSPKWMNELLRRSKNAPLIVHVYLQHSGSQLGPIRSLEKALRNMERIQDLWIDCPHDMIEVIQPRLNVAAPFLRSLYLSARVNEDDHFVINKDTLPGAMPDLRKVYLSSFSVDWSSSMFNGLTELTLGHLFNEPMDCWNGILRILRQLPHLRQLRLDTIVPPDTDVIFPQSGEQGERISLPRLEKLALTGPISWQVSLLTLIELPSSTIVELECYCEDPRFISMLLALIPDQIGNYPPVPGSIQRAIRYLDVDCGDNGWTFTYGLSSPHTYRADISSSRRRSLGSQVTILDGSEEMSDISAWFIAFPVAQLDAIAVHGDLDDSFGHEDLRTEIFRNASQLYMVKAEVGLFRKLTRALHPRGIVIPAPKLIDITLSRITFDRRYCSCGRDHAGLGNVQCLLHALAKRAEAGNPLPRLFLFNCTNITKDDVTALSKVVWRLEYHYSELGEF